MDNNEGKPMDTYDMIVIGIGEKGKSTMKQLNEQGQDVMYIELTSDMLTTMICHQPPKQDEQLQNDLKKNNNHQQNNAKIHLQKQDVHTPAGTTTTYTFHIQEEITKEVELPKEVPEAEVSKTHPYQEFTTQEYTPKADNPYPYLTWPDQNEIPDQTEQPKVKNLFDLEADEFDLSELEPSAETGEFEEIETVEVDSISNEAEEISNDYFTLFNDNPIEPIEDIFDKEEQENVFDQKDDVPLASESESDSELNENQSLELLHKLKPSSLSQQQAEEILIREQRLNKKKNPSTPNPTINLFDGFNQELDYSTPKPVEKKSSVQSEENTSPLTVKQPKLEQTSLLDSVLNKPFYSPKESRLRKRPKKQQNPLSASTIDKPKLIPSNELPLQMDQTTNNPPVINETVKEQQKISTVEPFTTRRRARVQKKQRFLSTVERFQGNKISSNEIEDTSPVQQQTNETPKNTEFFFQQTPLQKPKPKQINYEDVYDTDALEAVETNESDSLKRDNIEFEEPYGYNSWEEFMYPASQNNRKRQEMDKIQKRKIALRGLHNLINNLG